MIKLIQFTRHEYADTPMAPEINILHVELVPIAEGVAVIYPGHEPRNSELCDWFAKTTRLGQPDMFERKKGKHSDLIYAKALWF